MNDLSKLTWVLIKNRFRLVFSNEDEQRILWRQLRELILMKNENYDEYLKKFMTLNTRIENISEDEILNCFIDGLNERVRGEVLAKKPKSFNEAKELANWFYEVKFYEVKFVANFVNSKINLNKLSKQLYKKPSYKKFQKKPKYNNNSNKSSIQGLNNHNYSKPYQKSNNFKSNNFKYKKDQKIDYAINVC